MAINRTKCFCICQILPRANGYRVPSVRFNVIFNCWMSILVISTKHFSNVIYEILSNKEICILDLIEWKPF